MALTAESAASLSAVAERGERPDGASPSTLSRELAEFLMDLAIAMHKHAI